MTQLRKNKHHIDFTTNQKSLSILITTDGFSFCINDAITNTTISFSKYEFEQELTDITVLLHHITNIFTEDQDLHQNFSSLKVIHYNNKATLVPNAYFNESNLKHYLNYNIETNLNDYITFDEIGAIKAKNIYIPFVEINDYFFQNFGEFEFKHHSSVLIEKLVKYSAENNNNNFFVHVLGSQLDVIITNNGNLLLFNSFVYNTANDFIYYILLVAEQLEMNPEEFTLTLLGEINENDDNFKICYTYIRNIEFIRHKNDFFTSSDTFLNHSNYILIS